METHEGISCRRCGNCCSFKDEVGNVKICKHLVRLNKDKTLCRVYNDRIGKLLYKRGEYEVRCGYRKDQDRIIIGCSIK